MVACDMMVVATGPVASAGANSPLQLLMRERRASNPASTAQVTSQRTISLRRQLTELRVSRVTCRPSWRAAFSRGGAGGGGGGG